MPLLPTDSWREVQLYLLGFDRGGSGGAGGDGGSCTVAGGDGSSDTGAGSDGAVAGDGVLRQVTSLASSRQNSLIFWKRYNWQVGESAEEMRSSGRSVAVGIHSCFSRFN